MQIVYPKSRPFYFQILDVLSVLTQIIQRITRRRLIRLWYENGEFGFDR